MRRVKTAVFSWKSPAETIALPHAYLWGAAVHWARKWFDNVIFYGDARSTEMLVYGLELPFTSSAPLPALPDDLVHVRDLTKLSALYLAMDHFGPCIHHDFDAQFRRKPPEEMFTSDFVCEFKNQRGNGHMEDQVFNQLDALHARLGVKRLSPPFTGLASGIMGGCAVERIAALCRGSIENVVRDENREAFREADGFTGSLMCGEMEYGAEFPDAWQLTPFGPHQQDARRKLGYSHLAGGKTDNGLLAIYENLFRMDFPEAHWKVFQNWNRIYSS